MSSALGEVPLQRGGPVVGTQVEEFFRRRGSPHPPRTHLARVGVVRLGTFLEGWRAALAVTADQFIDPGLGNPERTGSLPE